MTDHHPKETARSISDKTSGLFQDWSVTCLDRLFSAMADPTRLQILHLLTTSDELTTGEIAAKVGLSIAAISHQLSLLRDRNLVTAQRRGRSVFYRLSDEHVRELLEVGISHACADCRRR